MAGVRQKVNTIGLVLGVVLGVVKATPCYGVWSKTSHLSRFAPFRQKRLFALYYNDIIIIIRVIVRVIVDDSSREKISKSKHLSLGKNNSLELFLLNRTK